MLNTTYPIQSHRPQRPRGSVGLALACLLLGSACGTDHVERRAAGDERLNLVLITVDSLRFDRLSYAGHERETSPSIDALAKVGVQFTTAYSEAGWTLPSVASILSGQYPSEHGATRFGLSMREGLLSIAQVLSDEGYATQAYISHVALKPKFGLGRGFDVYDDSVLSEGEHHRAATAEKLTDMALAALPDLQEPYFLWVHYFDPHFAYLPHAEWDSFGKGDLNHYDREIAYTDKHIGRLLEQLKTTGEDQRSVVVFTADHGEEFGEHGGKWHTSLYDEVARIPLVIRAPGLAPGINLAHAQQVDLMPTLLKLIQVQAPANLPGRDLLAADPNETRPIYMERIQPPHARQQALRLGRFKLIVTAERVLEESEFIMRGPPDAIEPGIHLFDIDQDPLEQNDLYDPTDEESQLMMQMLQKHFASFSGEEGDFEMDEDYLQQLQALGYVK